MTRIGTDPRTDPRWIDKQVMNGQQGTDEDNKVAQKQNEIITKTLGTLTQTVRKGDFKAAREQEAQLKEQFSNLSTEEKQFMYNLLHDKNKIASTFQYRLATASRERLLKTLNPDHVTSPRLQEKMARDAKASKTSELNTSGTARQSQLQNFKSEISSVPLGGADFQNKISKDSGIPSIPLGGEDFQKKFPTEPEIPSIPLGGKDFQEKISKDSGIPSVPLGGEDFQKRISKDSGVPSTPLGGINFKDK